MRKRKKWLFVAAPLAIAAFIWIGGEVVMQLWNWLLPNLFGLRQITFWQALGLLALCRILFGGIGGHGRRGWRRHRTEPMTPDERAEFRQSLRARCGPAAAPDATPTASS